jgi:xylulokinase
VVFAHLDQLAYDSAGRLHTFCHAVSGKWHVMSVTQGAGLSLQWLRNRLAPESTYDQLTAEAATAPAGSQGLFWLPYLMGERSPHLDPHARGGLIGLTAKHTRADLIRAVIEGVSFSQKDCLDIMQNLGVHVDSVRASGGGARSPFWRQVLANVFGKRIVRLSNEEGAAYGAALLAMTGTGEFASVPEACQATIREADCLTPQPAEAALYAKAHQIYRALYPALAPIYSQIAEMSGEAI